MPDASRPAQHGGGFHPLLVRREALYRQRIKPTQGRNAFGIPPFAAYPPPCYGKHLLVPTLASPDKLLTVFSSAEGGPPLSTSEALVIVNASLAEETLTRVSRSVKIHQRLPPRIAVVKGEPAELDALKHVVGVNAVCGTPIPGSVLEILEPTERLFVEAWASGRKPKASRLGDGLPWDADGFQPPDIPAGDHRKR